MSEKDIDELVAIMTLEQKVRLLTGRDFWSTWPDEALGLRSIVFSDGPAGVRGISWDEREPSLSLPSGTALGATWDRELAERYGAALAVEAIRKNVDVVLGPTINLHRSPLGGRHFESFSEDPELTAQLAAAYVRGIQSHGIGATPKHYVANEAETERFTADSVVDERTLRELYLRPFEAAVVEGDAWALMSAYNSVNGVTASENDLLRAPLREEWGFEGLVVSDWTAVRTTAAAAAEQDLAMPGPHGAWGGALVTAVRSGEVDEGAIDRKIARLLRLASRVGALSPSLREASPDALLEDGVGLAREVAARSFVLVKNDDLLPIAPRPGLRVAVIGQSAAVPRTAGGGSATVIPERNITPLEGIRDAYPEAEIEYRIGAVIDDSLTELPVTELINPNTGAPGVRVTLRNAMGDTLHVEDRFSTRLIWLGSHAPIQQAARVEIETIWTPTDSRAVRLDVATMGQVRVRAGEETWAGGLSAEGADIAVALLAPPALEHYLNIEAGQQIPLFIQIDRRIDVEGTESAMSVIIGTSPEAADEETLIDDAAEAAGRADVVVLVVGTTSAVESEGFDRVDLSLPGRQDELARRVLAANPNTVVVVNSGAPVILPWQESARAVLLGWFGGQEFGHAVADVISGTREPGGRLPTTWPAALTDVPVLNTTPVEGRLAYSEGLNIGYRAWQRENQRPQWAFGHGLSYSSWAFVALDVPRQANRHQEIVARVRIRNTGHRAGRQVVQVYVQRFLSKIDRPALWLAGFTVVDSEAGAAHWVDVAVPARAFEHWTDQGWQVEPGTFTLKIGFASDSLPLSTGIELA
ncbi:beta-glucosidase [Herbiconiux ginsengi]|uniref:Beta-glucosidase n=1 Tax=Herbiconiux ginsengi TaxID=381665 RepID=A0A1H3LKB0_9MICO|nr:glycoside hydrolase family 3 C-terminal domain-containing protein [Herbiconiux ginsengi]SDY64841.1 beta-glucosidase [Herbiconiux ginsengi]